MNLMTGGVIDSYLIMYPVRRKGITTTKSTHTYIIISPTMIPFYFYVKGRYEDEEFCSIICFHHSCFV